MIKTFFSICIVGAFGLLVVAIARPEITATITDRVLGVFIETRQSEQLPIPTKTQTPTKSSLFSYLQTNKQGKNILTIEDIIVATNTERTALGLDPLSTNTKLIASAKLKVDDMVTKQYFEHVSPTGKDVSDLGNAVGYDYIIMGENLALGNFTDATDLLTAWMNSPGHRANILNAGYSEIGVYAAKGMYNGKEVWFAVQHFGTPRTACPAIDLSLKALVNTLNTDLKKREAVITTARADLEASNTGSGEAYKAKVANFNTLVAQYNAQLAISQQQIAKYNKQVVAFNTCLTVYQKNEPIEE